jgi:hypothetical protein
MSDEAANNEQTRSVSRGVSREISSSMDSQKKYVVAIVLFGLVARLVMLGVNYNNLEMDSSFVILGEIARNIVNGNGLVVNEQNITSTLNAWRSEKKLIDPQDLPAPTQERFVADYNDEPGYGILLAGLWRLFGSERWIYVRILQILIDCWMILLILYIGTQLSGPKVGLVAAALYACFLPGIELVVRPHRDVWVTFAYILSVAVMLKISRTENKRSEIFLAIGLGLLIGCTAWMRSTIVAYGIACALSFFILRSPGRAFKLCAILLTTFVLIMAPLVKRNYDAFGQIMITRGAFWHSFWAGVGQFDNPLGMIENDHFVSAYFQRLDSTAVYGTPRYEQVLRQEAMRFIAEHPFWYAGTIVGRAGVILAPKIGRELFFQSTSIRSDTGILNQKVSILPLLAVDGLMAAGLLMGLWLSRREKKTLLIVALPLLYTLATLSPFYVVGRNIMNVYFVTILFASVSAIWLWERRSPGIFQSRIRSLDP